MSAPFLPALFIGLESGMNTRQEPSCGSTLPGGVGGELVRSSVPLPQTVPPSVLQPWEYSIVLCENSSALVTIKLVLVVGVVITESAFLKIKPGVWLWMHAASAPL